MRISKKVLYSPLFHKLCASNDEQANSTYVSYLIVDCGRSHEKL